MNAPNPQTEALFSDWIFLSQTAVDGLLVWLAWLRAWQTHPMLGSIPSELFDAILADMERHGLGQIINSQNTRSLRRAVTGEHKL